MCYRDYYQRIDREYNPFNAITIEHNGVTIYEHIQECEADFELNEEALEAINNPRLGAANVAADRKGAELLHGKGLRIDYSMVPGYKSGDDLLTWPKIATISRGKTELLEFFVGSNQTAERALGKDQGLAQSFLAAYEKHAQLERINANISAINEPESQAQKENENEA